MKGYTLIELLVTITIIVLVTGSSMAAYLTYNENRRLDIDGKNLSAFINKVRAKAVFLEYPKDCSGLINFTVSSELNSKGERTILKYFANCSSGQSSEIHEEVLTSSVMDADLNISFLPISGNTNSQNDVEITIRSTKGTAKIKKVVINQFLGTNNVVNKEE